MGKKAETKFIIKAVDKTGATLKRLRSNFKKTGQQISSMGSAMSMGLTAPIVAFGALSLKAAGDFEASMNRVQAVSGATGEEFAAMNSQAKLLGKTTQYSASEAGTAMGFLAQAGFKANEILSAMPSTLELAAAAQMDLGEAADITSNILTGYGKSVADLGHVNDVLVKATTSTNTNLSQLGEAMAYVGPVASGMGLSIEETTAAIGMLGNAGIQGSMAGTTLRASLAALANPSAEAAKLLGQLGVHATDSAGNMKPLNKIITQLSYSGASAGEMMEIFGKRAGPGMMALVKQGSGALQDLTSDLKNSGGTAASVAATQMKGFNGSIKKLKSAFEGLQIALMDSGIMAWFTGFISRVAGWISNAASASKETQRFALKILGIAAAIGPVLFILGKLVSGIAFLTSPIGWVITAVGLLTVAWVRWGAEIKTALAPVITWVKTHFDDLVVWLYGMIEKLLGGIAGLLDKMRKLPGQVGKDMGSAADSLNGWKDSLALTREKIIEADDGAALLSATLERLGSWTDSAMDKIKGLGGSLDDTTGSTQGATVDLEALKAEVEGLGTATESTGVSLWGMGEKLALVQGKIKAYQEHTRAARAEQKRLALAGTEAMNTLKSSAGQAADGMVNAIGAAVFESKNLLESLGSLAKSVFSGIMGGLMKAGLGYLMPQTGFLSTLFKAKGGPVTGGSPYIVGERGPELFMPGLNGTIIPNKALGSGGGSSVEIGTLNVSLKSTISNDPISLRRTAKELYDEIKVVGTLHGPVVV